jgi:hypothetical protein
MSLDCQWVEKNLEAFFCDRLSESDSRLARAHMDSCESCRKEAESLNAIDPMVKNYFQRELEIARRPRVFHKGRVLGLSGAGAVVVAAMLILALRLQQTSPVLPSADPVQIASTPTSSSPASTPAKIEDEIGPRAENKANAAASSDPKEQSLAVPPSESQAQVKIEDESAVRAKPVTGAAAVPPDRKSQPLPATPSEMQFQVVDPAGYSHTLEEFKGHVVVIAMWSPEQKEAIRNIERLYRTYAGNPKFRFLGVSHERAAKPGNTTFPMLYNRGSSLFGAEPGEFVMLDESGGVQLRGSLVTDIDLLRKALQEK